jgi:hypothetical protein
MSKIEMAEIISIKVRTSSGDIVEIERKDLNLLLNDEIPYSGFFYESESGDLLIDLEEE